MTDPKKLLAEATPLPWNYDFNSPKTIIAEDGSGAFVMRLGDARVFVNAVQMDKNVDLALHAVNHLPDYLAAVEALELCIEVFADGQGTNPTGPFCALTDAGHDTIVHAREALRRLRDEVPA